MNDFEVLPIGTEEKLAKALGLLQMVHDKKLVETVQNDQLGLLADIGEFLEEMK